MSIKHEVKNIAQKFGIQISRYNAAESQQARLLRLLIWHRIDTVIDVGANDGGYGRFLRQAGYAGNILSFEPLNQPYQRLKIAATADKAWYVAPRMALGEKSGEIEINVASNSTSSSVLPMKDLHIKAAPYSRYVGVERTRIERLDSLSHPVIDAAESIMLKIDTQGYEMPVLLGAQRLFPRIRGIQLEMSLTPLYDGQVLYRQMIDWLASKGYSIWNVIPGFIDQESGRMLQMDGIFFLTPECD